MSILSLFREFFARRKLYAEQRAYRDGYDWMAGELLRGKNTVVELERQHASCMWSKTAFDDGVLAAFAAWRAR